MRIVEIVEEWVEEMKLELRRELLRRKNRHLSDEQLRPGHRYRDRLSGEELDVVSIGTQVEVEPLDSENRDHWSTPKDSAQGALDVGLLDHDKRRCPACPNVRG